MKNFTINFKSIVRRKTRWLLTFFTILTLGVGQMWATTATLYIDIENANWAQNSNSIYVWDSSKSKNIKFSYVSTNLYKSDEEVTQGITLYFKQTKQNDPNTTYNQASGTYNGTNNCFRLSGWTSGSFSYNISKVSKTNYIYFNNATTNWSSTYKYFVIGHDEPSAHSKVYSLSAISNTKLLYVAQSSNDWSDVTYYGFNASNSSYSNGNWGTSSFDDAAKRTAPYTGKYDMNSGSSYYCEPSSASNDQPFTITYKSGYSSIPKFNAVQAAKKRDTGTSYSDVDGTYPATISLQGTYLSGNGSSSQSTISRTKSSDGTDESTYGAVVTGKITHTYSSLSSSYYFEGWGTSTTPSSTSSSYSYNISAATTVYAFFSKVYALTYDSKGTKGSSSISVSIANFSGTKTSGSSIPTGHTITFTASPATGYEVEGWYSDASCTSAYTSGSGGVTISGSGNVTFTLASLNAAQAVYCKFQPKTTVITLDGNAPAGETVTGDGTEVTATYNAALPSFSALTCTGDYALTGYWTETSGGTKVINRDGTFAANSGIWNRTDGATLTLHAQWSAEPAVYLSAAKLSDINVGETVRLTATGRNAANITQYEFYLGEDLAYTATTSSTSATYDYVVSTTGDKSFTVKMYYNSGSNNVTSSAEELSLNTPTIGLASSKTTGINVGETVTLTATATNLSPSSTNKITYKFYEGSTLKATETVNSLSQTYSYTPTTTGNKTVKVTIDILDMATMTSSNVALSLNTPSVSLSVKAGSSNNFYLGEGSTILKATPSNVGAGVTPSYVFTDQIGGGKGVTSASQTGTEWTYNPTASGQAKSRTMKVTMTVGGSTYNGTVTVTVYEKWNIYVKNNCSWPLGVYYYGYGNGESASWPGTACSVYRGVWYTVTLDNKYPYFILGNGYKDSGKRQLKGDNTHASNIATYPAGSAYTFTYGGNLDGDNNQWYSLTSASMPTAPMVSTNTISTKNLTSATLGGNISSDGGDVVSEYGYYYSTNSALSSSNLAVGTKVAVGTDNKSGSYSQSQTGLSVGTTYYVLAYTTNPHGTGYGTVRSFSTTAATLSLEGTANYEANTMTITPTTNMTAGNGFSGTYYVCCTCTSKPGGAADPTITWNGTTKKLEISGASTDGDYTFNVKLKPASDCSGSAFNNANANVTVTMKTIPDRSGLTIGHARYNTTYMGGNGASATPYFIYTSRAATYGKLNLTATLPAALASGEQLWYSVGGSEIGQVTVAGTAASVTMDLPNKTVGAGRTAVIKFYSKLDGQAASDAKKASATVYYTVSNNPVVTISATCDGNPIVGDIPQNATIVVSASATNIPGEPTFVFKKGDGEYSATTSYTIPEASTTMYAKTTYLGDDWTASMTVTTYATNSVTYVLSMTDLYGDDASTSTSRLFKSGGEEHTAPTLDGYTFTGWTCTTSNVEVSDNSGSTWKSSSSNATVYVRATAAGGTLTATYTAKKRIYFDNSKAKWSGNIYVYFFNGDSWYNDYNSGNDNGPGVVPRINQIGYGQMTRIGESNIYYYEYGALSFTKVAFSIHNQYNYSHLYNTKGVWRTDYKECNPCYVAPENSDQTKYDHGDNKPTYYYNNGYWRRYMPQTSPFSLQLVSPDDVDKGKFEIEHPGIDEENFVKEVELDGNSMYEFNLQTACGGSSYGNTGSMTKDNHTNWTFTQGTSNCHITTTATGIYKFYLSTADGKVKLTVEYPLSQGDYQVYYSDNTGNNNNYSNYIRKNTSGSAKQDRVSFFVKKNASPKIQIKRCSGFTGSTPNWENVGSAKTLTVDRDSVYNYIFEQNGTGTSIDTVGHEYYSGNYYIRTDGAAGGWMNYLSNPDNKMKHTDKASALAAGYNYYYMRYIGDADGNSTANVKFCIATDYNDCVSQEHASDPEGGSFPGEQYLTGKGANVRFTYHPGTNATTRTCIGGSAHDPNYLVISGTNLQKSDGSAWATSAMTDANDWIYTFELKAADEATIQIQSHYNDRYVTVYPSKKVLDVGDSEYYPLRIVYDYKTNEVVAAYIPSTVSTDLTIDVDIMFIRQAKDNKPDEDAPTTTLTLSGGAKITGDPKTLYGAIKFEKDFVRAEGLYAGLASNRPQRSTYWISFPFDVQVKDIFGLGDYTETWILQRYRGDLRAERGWFLETKSFWEYIFDTDYVLEAGQGYVLSLDCEAIQWPNSQTEQYLYFPSKNQVSTISSVLPSSSMSVPEYECKITTPADRTIKDSHWNVIGIPGFADAWGQAKETVSTIGGDFNYFYAWDAATNTLSSESAKKYNFKFMHSYMVQYHGNIDWSADEPAAVPARRSENAKPEEVEFRLDLMQGEQEADHTFITLMDKEQITTGFDMNTDLVKMFNSNKANIYTVINTDVQAAANCLPMTEQTTLVPVGVQVKTDGEYTFSIPAGTSGVGVTLIDNETDTRTNLGLTDYTVNLTAGTIDGRFMLEISPIQGTAMSLENVQSDNVQGTKARKMMIDGIMYIIRDGRIYDAQGARMK